MRDLGPSEIVSEFNGASIAQGAEGIVPRWNGLRFHPSTMFHTYGAGGVNIAQGAKGMPRKRKWAIGKIS